MAAFDLARGRALDGSTSSGCFLCNMDIGTPIFAEGAFTAKQCPCGIAYIAPAPDETSIDPRIDHHHRSYYSAPAAKRIAWMRRFLSEGRLLDVGCGEGELAAVALAEGYAVEGVDPSEPRAAVAEASTGIRVHRARIEDAALPDHAYDGLFHVDLLSHFPDPVRSLRAMHRCLRPGGVMCFEVGLFGNLSPAWRRWAGRGNLPAHRWFYDEAAVRRLLDATGFELLGVERYALGASTIVTTLGLKLLKPRELASSAPMLSKPVVRGWLGTLYYGLQVWLRYGLGAHLRIGGPQAAFVAARAREGRSASD